VIAALVRTALLALVSMLAACSSLPRTAAVGDTVSGRLSVAVDGAVASPQRNVSAAFELSGTPRDGRLDLTSPLGNVMARARWAPGEVMLSTPEASKAYPDLESLTHDVLGESLPVAALFDWLRGRPWSGAASQPADGGFEQLGWAVNLARFDEGWITARRAQAPAVTVRAKVDR
jgi:outer membrane lipoprotein LolB